MTVDICIPAYNEEEIIERAAGEVLAAFADMSGVTLTLTVADNASTDETAARASKVRGVRVLRVEQKGKGAAVVAAARKSTGDFFGFIDADLSAEPRDFAKLFDAIEQGADIAIGSRLLNTAQVRRGFLRSLSSRLFNVARRVLLGINVIDSQCGLKLMNPRGRQELAACEETGWFTDMEFLSRAERAGLRVQEVAVRWDEERFAGRVSKLSVLSDGLEALRAMFRIRGRLGKK